MKFSSTVAVFALSAIAQAAIIPKVPSAKLAGPDALFQRGDSPDGYSYSVKSINQRDDLI